MEAKPALGVRAHQIGEVAVAVGLLDNAGADTANETDAGRLVLYAALAAERCDRLRERLALATELTELLASAADGRPTRSRSRS